MRHGFAEGGMRVYVTTSVFSEPAQIELAEDKYPFVFGPSLPRNSGCGKTTLMGIQKVNTTMIVTCNSHFVLRKSFP